MNSCVVPKSSLVGRVLGDKLGSVRVSYGQILRLGFGVRVWG